MIRTSQRVGQYRSRGLINFDKSKSPLRTATFAVTARVAGAAPSRLNARAFIEKYGPYLLAPDPGIKLFWVSIFRLLLKAGCRWDENRTIGVENLLFEDISEAFSSVFWPET